MVLYLYKRNDYMELTFTNEYSEEFDEYEEIYIQIMKKTFKHIKKKGNFIVEVNLIDNKTIHNINTFLKLLVKNH